MLVSTRLDFFSLERERKQKQDPEMEGWDSIGDLYICIYIYIYYYTPLIMMEERK